MPRRTYNTFYKWIQQDDFLTGWANIIDAQNIDGLRDGYFATIWPKVQKQLTTLDAVNAIRVWELSSWALTDSFAWDASWNIYRLDGADNTPSFTLASWNTIQQIVKFNGFYYFFHQDITQTSCSIARILASEITQATPDWSTIDEAWNIINAVNNTPVLVFGDILFIWVSDWIATVDNTQVFDDTSFNFTDDYVLWITAQGTTFKVYDRSGKVYYWDGTSASFSSSQQYEFSINWVQQFWGIDYILSEDGDTYISSWYSVQRVTKAQDSLRLEDNSTYQKKLDMSKTPFNGDALNFARADIYSVSSNDSVPWIYKYGRLIPWLPLGYHKIITQDNTWTDVSNVYTIDYYERTLSRMYFSFKQGATFWIDFIDLKDLTTAQDWNFVTDVFTGWTMFKKKIDRVRITTSFTSWNNFIKLYVRTDNNAIWELVETINNATDVIARKNISSLKWDFVDIQFKVEIHNDLQTNTPPLPHELSYDYTIIET